MVIFSHQQIAAAHAAVGGLAAHHAVMATDGELMLLARQR
jgi:hypothetical protein